MVRHDEFDECFPFRVGDRVRVSSCSRKYRGRCGVIVVGREGSGFTSTFLSAYVQMKRDDGSGNFCATLRCTSLVLVPRPRLTVARLDSEPVARCELVRTNRDLLPEMCARLDALDLRSQAEEDDIIVAFAGVVLDGVTSRR